MALLAGSLLKAIAAAGAPLPMGPWDVKAVSSAGRLANHLALQTGNFVALALHGLAPRTYRKMTNANETADLQLPIAAQIGKTRDILKDSNEKNTTNCR